MLRDFLIGEKKLELSMKIAVGSRRSPLALAQVEEALGLLRQFFDGVFFDIQTVETRGDQDRTTSLRALDKTDFFTKEIDEKQLAKECRISIHSAKDLPDPLPKGLAIAAITKGVDPSDSLVLNTGETLQTLRAGALIATSSIRREENLRTLRTDFTFRDVRGTIGERLSLLEKGEVDGVVIAEAALIRLGLTHLNRLRLPGNTVPFQGQLAIVALEGDEEMQKLFSVLDVRKEPHSKTILYTGLELPEKGNPAAYHCPLIRIEPRPLFSPAIQNAFSLLPEVSHLIFTSKTAVALFCEGASKIGFLRESLFHKRCIAVGRGTANACLKNGLSPPLVAAKETAEGVVDLLSRLDLKTGLCFWPHAAGARPVISDYLRHKGIPYFECILYDTHPSKPHPLPLLQNFKEIVFTSPSTVDAFLEFYGSFPPEKKLSCQGPITQAHLQTLLAASKGK